MRYKLALLLTIAVLLSSCAAGVAADIFVATNGNDTTGNGSISNPYATLLKATSVAVAGDTIQVRAGAYVQHLSWDAGANGTPGAYITIQAYDGDRTASFVGEAGAVNTISLTGRQYCKVIGLDVAATQSSGYYCVKVSESSYCEVDRCYLHDSGVGDVVKGNYSSYLLFADNEITRPGGAAPSGNNQGIDNVIVDYGVFRNNYIHDFPDMAYYAKGGSDYNVAEGNVVYDQDPAWLGPAAGFGQSTGKQDQKPGADYQSFYNTMRNNIFTACPGGAVGTYGCYHGYLYNNVMHNCGTLATNRGIVWQRDSTDPWGRNTDGFYIYNNVFLDTRGQMPTVYRYHSGNYTDWQHDYNNFYNNGNPIPTAGMFDPNLEPHSTFGNPNLANPTGTATTWAGWKDRFRITAASALLIDRGTSSAGTDPVPAVHTDMDGAARPQGAGWDIGAFEYGGGGGSPPVANFTGNPTSGAAPLAVAFTDTSTNSPTSWSWAFGDSSTSTAQHPSHTYAAGTYTVTLTAANAYGSDGETKTNYITATSGGQPPVAQFVGVPTSGTAPLAVAFTDQSTNSPTSWSWAFGDSATSTAQHPSHTYAAGTYTVTLTATNAYGSDGETKTNYITATSGGGGDYSCASMTVVMGTLSSGDHTSVHTSDDTYLVVTGEKITGNYYSEEEYTFNTGLGSLSSLSVTSEGKASVSRTLRVYAYNYSTSVWVVVYTGTLTTTDTTTVVPVSNPSQYISGGTVRVRLRAHGNGTFSHSTDFVKITAAP